MKISYFSDATRKPFSGERNEGIEAVPGLLTQLKASGDDVEFVDTSNLTQEDRFKSYLRAAEPAMSKHYEIRGMFGTNRRSACCFGAEVPALLVTTADSVVERLFRKLYDEVRKLSDEKYEKSDPFSMSTAEYSRDVAGWFHTLWAPSVIALHGVVVAAVLAMIAILR